MSVLAIISFYFSVMMPWQSWPVVIGPYASREECSAVRESLDSRGYVTDGCYQLPHPQEDSQKLRVGELPKEGM
jgi:hypothetical protein